MKALSPSQRLGSAAGIDTVLRAAGAHNWSNEAIEAHKAHELAEAPPPNFLWNFDHKKVRAIITPLCLLADDIAGGFFLTSVLFCAAACISWALSHYFVITIYGGLFVASGVALLAAVASLLLNLLAWQISYLQVRPPAQWEAVPLDDYVWAKLPTEAQHIIARTQHFMPNAPVVIHELRQGVFVLDPILEIDKRFVLVWDGAGNIISPPA